MNTFDVAIIGGGPAGYSAAEKAAKAGLKVILFEKEAVGGVCLNEGCIPTKTLLYTAKLYDSMKTASKYGLYCPEYTYDLSRIMSRKQRVVRKLNAGIRRRLLDSGVTSIYAEAHIVSYTAETVEIRALDETYMAHYLILATGSHSVVPPIEGIDKIDYWSSREALLTDHIPENLLIVGGGVIGMEFASFFTSMGSKVTIVELLPEILAGMDTEIAGLYRQDCEAKGVVFHLDTRIQSVKDHLAVVLHADGKTLEIPFDKILLAAGRKPNLDVIRGLPVVCNNKGVQVTCNMQTSMEHVYACGDITGFSMLAHTAEREAIVAVNHILGIEDAMRYRAIPGVLYASPEVASVGYTQEQLDELNVRYDVKKIPMTYAGRFVVENESFVGLCKVLIDEHDKILGVHILGTPASELIVAAAMAIDQRLTVEQWQKTVFPHPTVAEVMKETLSH